MAQRVAPHQDKELRVHEETIVRAASALRDARRTRNHKSGGFLDELRCECARPECRATVPAAAHVHRKRPERFIVVPDHTAGDTVIAAADRFFVVEPSRPPSPLPERRSRYTLRTALHRSGVAR
jgi:hypothetical protein